MLDVWPYISSQIRSAIDHRRWIIKSSWRQNTHYDPSDSSFSSLNKISCRALWTFHVSDVKMNISRVCGSSQPKDLPLLLTWDRGLATHG